MHLKYHFIEGKWFLVLCHMAACVIYNANCTRRLFTFDVNKSTSNKLAMATTSGDEELTDVWFTCSAKAYDHETGEEFIVVATNEGRFYRVKVGAGGAQFTKEVAFTMGLITPITAMVADAKSKHLLIAQGNGDITLLKCSMEDQWDMVDVGQNPHGFTSNPATCVDVLSCGMNMFVVGFASGTVRLFLCETGKFICELAAHSRQINAIAAHPTKQVFATCSDDTFLNLWEVTGSKIDNMDINLIVSSRVNDYQLTGICFGKETYNSIVCSVYDYKFMLVWDDII